MQALKDRDWRALIEKIRRGNCILVLGPESTVAPDDATGLPLSCRLAEHLSAQEEGTVPDRHDLAIVAQTYLNIPGRERIDLEMEVGDFYRPYATTTSDLHRNLAQLPFNLCLTVTPDNFMTEALNATPGQKTPTPAHYDHTDPLRGRALNERDHPIVYSLMGSIDNPPSLVLSETEMLQYLKAVGRSASGLPDYIAAQLADPKMAFLFLGFGFQRWHTRILLHVLRAANPTTRSVALESEAFFRHQDVDRTTHFFDQANWIDFRRDDWCAFSAELLRRFKAVAPPAPSTASSLATAPKAFLCHDSRDRDRVVALEQRLHELGVDTWRDEQQLRGGEDWDRRIVQVLRKQVDYVLVCETPGMVSKGESYLHAELEEAQKRQSRFPGNEGFIWPLTLRPGAKFDELSDIHRRDVTTDDGVQRLARELLEHWDGLRNLATGTAL